MKLNLYSRDMTCCVYRHSRPPADVQRSQLSVTAVTVINSSQRSTRHSSPSVAADHPSHPSTRHIRPPVAYASAGHISQLVTTVTHLSAGAAAGSDCFETAQLAPKAKTDACHFGSSRLKSHDFDVLLRCSRSFDAALRLGHGRRHRVTS